MATYPTNTAVFGDPRSKLDGKPFTFTASPKMEVKIKQEPRLEDEGPTGTKRAHYSQDSSSKRPTTQMPISQPKPVLEARCYTPYPDAESEPYSPMDPGQPDSHQIEQALQDIIQTCVKDMVAKIKHHIKHECETALEAAW
jgi:hypothetical protein